MEIVQILRRGLLAAAVFILAGCAIDPQPTTRIVFSKTTINGQPVSLVLDTGSDFLWLGEARARRLGLKFGKFETAMGLRFAVTSDPAQVTVDDQAFAARLPIVRFALEADGLVSWPEVRDNILVFDGDNHTVRGVAQLPPETDGWLKLKFLPSRILLLETPLESGGKGTILVDTGSPFGIQMVPAQWKEWNAAHPGTPMTTHKDRVASFGAYKFNEAWADEVALGALRLSDVPVENMAPPQAEFLQQEAPDAKAVWALGMYALARMDFIVDWKNGLAYLRPKPAPGPIYPGVKRLFRPGRVVGSGGIANWTVSGDVKLNNEDLFLISASDEWSKTNTAAALADFARAIQLCPKDAEAYAVRGDVEAWLDDTDTAIADYTRAIQLKPDETASYGRRGVARQVRDDVSGALSDYDEVIKRQPGDSAYERLYEQALFLRLSRLSPDFSKTIAEWKPRWTKTIGLFLTGALSEKALLEAAKKSDAEPASGQRCEALYYIGMRRLSQGDEPGARESFQQCRATGLKDYDEYHLAGGELRRLDARL